MKKILLLLILIVFVMVSSSVIFAAVYDSTYNPPENGLWSLNQSKNYEHAGQITMTYSFSSNAVKEKYEPYLQEAIFMWKGSIQLEETTSGNMGTIYETNLAQTSQFIHSNTVNQGSSPFHITQWSLYINTDLLNEYSDRDIVLNLAHELGRVYGLSGSTDHTQIMFSAPSTRNYSEVRKWDIIGMHVCTDIHTTHSCTIVYHNSDTLCYSNVCTYCKAYISHNHNLEFDGCMNPYKCTQCNKSVGGSAWHDLSELMPGQFATCSTQGINVRYCIRESCSFYILYPAPLNPNNHESVNWTVVTPATCTQTGLKTGSCTACNAQNLSEVIPVNPGAHNFGGWFIVTQATCTTSGSERRNCTNNGCSHFETRTITILGHDQSGPNATCTTSKICARSNCNYVLQGSLGHLLGSWYTSVSPTCTSSGTRNRDCQRSGCSYSETESIPATGHSLGSWNTVVSVTCTTNGTNRRDCSNCSYYETITITAPGHSLGSWYVSISPTCTTNGTERRNCTRSGCTYYETRSINSLGGHNMGLWHYTVIPTCTTGGTERRNCLRSECTYFETRNVSALGHLYGSWYTTVQPTCTTSGTQRRNCTRSGCTNYQTQTISSLGHNWGSAYLINYYYCASRNKWIEVYRRNCTRSGCTAYYTYEEVVG